MSDLSLQAEDAAEKLLMADEDQLYEQLGIRAKAISKDLTICSSFEPDVTYDQTHMGIKDDVREFGKRLFNRWNVEAHRLICGSSARDLEDRSKLAHTVGLSEIALAGFVTTSLVSHLGLSPAIAVVIAAIAVKRFFRPAYEEFCQVWAKHLDG
ncbi:MAG: hypothetical protein ACM3SY_03760 [Candidatus Omnitrophota bacterium]